MTQATRETEAQGVPARAAALRVGSDISIRKLQVFWAVAHTGSMTKAARMLALAQPTLSQQLPALEGVLGSRLFERAGNSLVRTEFGNTFMRHAESVLRAAQELEEMVAEHGRGQQQTIRIGGLPSALRALVPAAMAEIRADFPSHDFDLHEGSPGDILEMLYARRISVALLAANTLGEVPAGFEQIPLIEDRHVLVVPATLDLEGIRSPETELPPAEAAKLRNVIEFVFGSPHSRRLQAWFDAVLPGNRNVARARSFELAVEMVRSGLGVCLAPSLSIAADSLSTDQLRLYGVDVAPRRIVALVPQHFARGAMGTRLLAGLKDRAAGLQHPALRAEPPFITERAPRGGL